MNRRNSARATSLLCGAAVLGIACWGGQAQADTKVKFEIAPQPLANALMIFGDQSGRTVLASANLTTSKSSRGLTAEADPEAALRELLGGTGLSYRRDRDVFVIVEADKTVRLTGPISTVAPAETVSGSAVEGLVVTAQKRRENIQDVPIAISAFTQDALTTAQIAGGPDLMTQVPNVTFTKTNFSSYSVQIRGIGTQAISATVDPAVAVALNNTAFIRNRFFEQEFFDLERVEVLRGPQGTLYGRNATAGVVNIITAKPSFLYETRASVDLSNYQSRRLEAMVNVPLIDDQAALRLAGAWTQRDGYVTNELTGQPIDGRNLWSTRLSFRLEPTDRISANLIWEHFSEDDDRLRSGKQLCKKHVRTEIAGIPLPVDVNSGEDGSPAVTYSQGCIPTSMYADDAYQTPNGYSLPFYGPLAQIGLPVFGDVDPYVSATQSRDLRVIESTRDPEYRARTDLAELQLEFDLNDGLTLVSETAYSMDTLFSTQDFNRFNTKPGAFTGSTGRPGVFDENAVFCDPQVGCSDRLVLVDLSTAESQTFSQEFRLTSDYDGPFNFSVGANFLRYDTEDKYYVFINSLSLWAAEASWTGTFGEPSPYDATVIPYIGGVTDNLQCLRSRRAGDPTEFQQITGCVYMDPNPIDSLNDQGHNYFLSRNPYRLISYAAFGEAYYNITPELKLTAGLRLTVDKKRAPRIPSWLLAADSIGYPVMEIVEQEWNEPTGRLAIDWKPDFSFTDDTLLYASYARGYKAGGMNPPPAVIASYGTFNNPPTLETGLVESLIQPKTFDAEYVDAFEIGAKNTFLDGGLTVNANAFYYDYQGYQISQIINRSAVNSNFDAEVWGFELEADWRPLENLKISFKGGYENTRMADGSQAIDLMDRTAGNPDWIVTRPFAAIPSNCILPVWLVTFGGRINVPQGGGGNPGPCLLAYQAHVDPVTALPYVANPTDFTGNINPADWVDYPGFDPLTAPNNGEGFFKDLSGNELPNAPHYTATLSADYSIPLPDEWLVTLHTDFYYQSEAWTRIFNTDGYDKLKAYTNVNFAAIFANENTGWRVMAYIKNAFDRDAITGAFLNSDDTGLTTNVFLTEPRLYGVRVTKEWTGASELGALYNRYWSRKPGEAYPFTLELGASLDRHTAPNAIFAPDFVGAFDTLQFPLGAQEEDLDWGDGRDVKLTYHPPGSKLSASAGYRFGRTNGTSIRNVFDDAPGGCLLDADFCADYPKYFYDQPDNYGSTTIVDGEEFKLLDFMVGRDFGLGGSAEGSSRVALGLRYAQWRSTTEGELWGMPDLYFPTVDVISEQLAFHRHSASFEAARKFEGVGPEASWEGSKPFFGNDEIGRIGADWEVSGGVLFGKQKTSASSDVDSRYFQYNFFQYYRGEGQAPVMTLSATDRHASKIATVPTLGGSIGLSYTIRGLKIGAGYRYDRFFDVLDTGFTERKTDDRTIDGPYFKVSAGFGG